MELAALARRGDPSYGKNLLRTAFADSEKRLRRIIELSSDYYWEQDAQFRFTLLRHRDRDFGARIERKLLRRTRWDLGGEPLDTTWDAHRAACEAHLPFSDLVVRRIDRHGLERYLMISGQPMFADDGTFLGYFGIAQDVSIERRDQRLLKLDGTIAHIFAGSESVDAALSAAIREICLSEKWCAGRYWRRDTETGLIGVSADWSGPDGAAYAAELRDLALRSDHGLIGSVWQSREPVWVPDVLADSRLRRRDLFARAGWYGSFLFPIVARGHTLGVLEFSAERMREPDDRLLQVVRALGTQTAHLYDRAAALARVKESEERYSSTIELAAIGISHVAPGGRFIHVNRQLCEMLGYTREELLALSVRDISHPDDRSATDSDRDRLDRGEIDAVKAEKRYVAKDGTPVWVRLSIAAKRDDAGRLLYHISVVEDISERKRAEERVQYIATHDEMTKLPNRAMFGQLLNHAIETARRRERRLAVLFMDLDRFKLINDTLGHEAGDALLRIVSERFKGCLRKSDVVARLGGDEFVVLMEEIENTDEVAAVARNLLSVAIQPIEILGQECRVTASVGISVFPTDADDATTLMKNADVAMYHAKEEGKNNFQFFSRDLKAQSIERLALESRLRRALENEELKLQYQAKISIKTGEITGVEALLRWWNEDLGSVSPGRFIPIAEDTGLIVPIGRWVLRTACEQNMLWQQHGLAPIPIAVNISPRQFRDPDLLRDIDSVLHETGMPARCLELEITEGMIMHNIDDAIAKLRSLKERGIRIAIDDFGTGYSSLAQLKRFPIDTLKVDRSFIRDIPRDTEDKAITQAIIAMGRTLGVTVVAEGVETSEQQEFLTSSACDEMQGFYFSKPAHPDALEDLIRSRSAANS